MAATSVLTDGPLQLVSPGALEKPSMLGCLSLLTVCRATQYFQDFLHSTSNELRRKHHSRVAPELDYAPGNLPTSRLSSHVTPGHHQVLQSTHPWKCKGQDKVFPAEAAQLQKDPAEIRTGPTSSPSIACLKNPLLALKHRQGNPAKDSALHLCKWLAMNKTFLPLAVPAAESPGNTSPFPVTRIHHPAPPHRARTKGTSA